MRGEAMRLRVQRTHLNFMFEESMMVTSCSEEVLTNTVWTGLNGMGWWQECGIICHTNFVFSKVSVN